MSSQPDSSVGYKATYCVDTVDNCYRFKFFCAFCDFHYTTGWFGAASEREAWALAERDARRHFNGCHKCGKWICDSHYNMDEMMCVECAPIYAKVTAR